MKKVKGGINVNSAIGKKGRIQSYNKKKHKT